MSRIPQRIERNQVFAFALYTAIHHNGPEHFGAFHPSHAFSGLPEFATLRRTSENAEMKTDPL
jgi:hypothetical protein